MQNNIERCKIISSNAKNSWKDGNIHLSCKTKIEDAKNLQKNPDKPSQIQTHSPSKQVNNASQKREKGT